MSNYFIKTTTTGNAAIAVFDGWVIEKGMENIENPLYNKGFNTGFLSDLNYHSDWNLLMPVCKKIWDLRIKEYSIEWEYFCCLRIHDSISTVWQAVVQFLEWHNNNQNNSNK